MHSERELERGRAVVELAEGVAHSLKQPLAVASGYLELVFENRTGELEPTTLAYLREIQVALQRMDEVINTFQQATLLLSGG